MEKVAIGFVAVWAGFEAVVSTVGGWAVVAVMDGVAAKKVVDRKWNGPKS